jgi:hypothetical protein
MDFEPPQRCNLVEFLRLEHNTFKDRLEVCKANLGGKLPALDTHTHHFDGVAARVNLATFAAVASAWDWSMPQQLQALAQTLAEAIEQAAPAQTAATTAPVVAETKEQREDRRLKACETAELIMPTSSKGRLPDGVGDVAGREGVTRQAFSNDVKAALQRRENTKREGATVHRA